jgi:NADPH:quinone reductase-like Zn-dependent oxidoreductase
MVFAVYAAGVDRERPLDQLRIGEVEPTPTPDDWVEVQVRAAGLNHHDLWALKGQALSADQVPMILGTDAAGVGPDGREVIVHSVIGDPRAGNGDETLDPKRSMLSERYSGTLARTVRVPAANCIPKPAMFSWQEAACLPTAFLTAYRMLTTKAQVQPGDTVLVQGAGGGVATALVLLGKALGARVWVTSRDEAKAADALARGADAVFGSGERLPERVDSVMETVGAATWSHSLKSLKPGGVVVISGATSGEAPSAELNRIFFLQLRILGSTMGTAGEFRAMLDLMERQGVRPVIDSEWPIEDARFAFERMAAGQVNGKLVLTMFD